MEIVVAALLVTVISLALLLALLASYVRHVHLEGLELHEQTMRILQDQNEMNEHHNAWHDAHARIHELSEEKRGRWWLDG